MTTVTQTNKTTTPVLLLYTYLLPVARPYRLVNNYTRDRTDGHLVCVRSAKRPADLLCTRNVLLLGRSVQRGGRCVRAVGLRDHRIRARLRSDRFDATGFPGRLAGIHQLPGRPGKHPGRRATGLCCLRAPGFPGRAPGIRGRRPADRLRACAVGLRRH